MTDAGKRAGIGAGLAVLGLLLVGVLTWRVSGIGAWSYGVDDPALHADGFYPAETGEGGGRLRWSRPAAGWLVPAVAARQVVTLELSAPRPAGMLAPTGITLHANGGTVPLTFVPGWADYASAAPSQVGLENAVSLTAGRYDDSFYPGPGDARRLTVAVRRVTVAPLPEPWGGTLPAPLPGALALALPALAWAVARRRAERSAMLVAEMVTIVLMIAVVLLPAPDLPIALAGVGAVLALLVAGLYARDGDLGTRLLARWQGEKPAVRVARGAALTAAYAALAVLATWPLATQWTTALPGWPGDNFAFLYKIWWVERVLRNGADLFNDPNVFYPFGFNFGRGEPTLPNTLPGALIALGAGPVAGYNLVLLAGFVGSGLGAYGLARALGASRPAAGLAGLIFMLAPFRLAQAAGHLQIAATQWLPLTLLFAERTLQHRRRWDAALAGLCFGLLALTAWYYALIGGLLLGGYIVLRLAQMVAAARNSRRRDFALTLPSPAGRGFRRLLPGSGFWRAWGMVGATFALAAGALVLPGLVPALRAAGEAPLSHSAKAADENSASPEDYLIPNALHPLWGAAAMQAHAQQNIIEDALYPGLVGLILAGVALAARRTRGRAWIWAALAGGCFVLSLGLYLHTAAGGLADWGGGPVPLPGKLFYDWVPGFSSLRAYARFGVGVALGVAVLAGLGATALLGWPRLARVRPALGAGLIALVLCDFWSAPNAWGVTQVGPNAVAGWLATQPAGAVMQLPLTSAIAGPPLYAGTYYGHPLAYGYETFEPPEFMRARPALAGFPSPAAFAVLRQWGVRYVVVAASSYGAQWPGTRAYFAGLPDWTEVYAAGQPPTWAAPFWVGGVRTELRDLLAPDELVVYRLK